MKATFYTLLTFAFLSLLIIFSCSKELSFEDYTAAGTLKDPAGICFSSVVHGTFYNGVTANGDRAYIEVKVNVQKTGNYNVSTDVQNGLQFADYGVFQTLGLTTIKLKPLGKAITHSSTTFNIVFDTSICSVTIDVQDSALLNHQVVTDTLPINNWQFTDVEKGITYKGLLEVNYIFTLGIEKILVLSSKKAEAPGDSTLLINILLPASGNIEKGTYSSDDNPTGMVFKTFSDACLNCVGGGLIPPSSGAAVKFIITDYNPSTKIVKGRFSGTTVNKLEAIVPIANGAFTALVE